MSFASSALTLEQDYLLVGLTFTFKPPKPNATEPLLALQ